MNHDDPARPRVSDRPAWAEAPNFVLPLLQLTPQGPGLWLVQFMFPSPVRHMAFSWVGKTFEEDELPDFLARWYEDPEECVRKDFALEPPRGKVWNIPRSPEIDGERTTTLTAQELDL